MQQSGVGSGRGMRAMEVAGAARLQRAALAVLFAGILAIPVQLAAGGGVQVATAVLPTTTTSAPVPEPVEGVAPPAAVAVLEGLRRRSVG